MRTDPVAIAGRPDRTVGVLYALFFASGFSALCLETVFSRHLGYLFGTTAYAVSTVLAAFMAGLALGSYVGGRLSLRVRRPVFAYGLAEFVVALYALVAPWLFSGLAKLVSHLGPHVLAEGERSQVALTAVRFGLASLLILPPTFMMGLGFPLLSRRLAALEALGVRVGRLYAVNTFGAAIGTLLSTYVLIAQLGLSGTLLLASAVNTAVFVACAWLRDPQLPPVEDVAAEASQGPTPWAAYLLALFSGFVVLSYEVVWTHVLALLVGTSTYAFGLVLSLFLLALACGGWLVSRHVASRDEATIRAIVGGALVALCLLVVSTHLWWERASEVFEFVGLWKPSFEVRELTRALTVAGLIFVPGTLMGMLFPAALVLLRSSGAGVGTRIGVAYAINTAGTIAGSVGTGFFILGRYGSERTVLGLSVLAVLPALALALTRGRLLGRVGLAVAAIAVVVMAAVGPRWDMSRMTKGSNIYFAPGWDVERHQVLSLDEDLHGGFTSVVTDGRVRTMMTNGKFEGNNGPERVDQVLFAIVPNLYARRFERALNIGIGTGQTLAVLDHFGYRELHAVDISPNIVKAARTHFKDVNGGVFDRKHVRVFLRDGRNHLLLNEAPYDVISIELTSVWFASAGNLYSREFYELASRTLAPGGILQQWVQLHHITLDDVTTITNTLREVFPHVELWLGGHQGILVASHEPLELRFEPATLPAAVREDLRVAKVPDREALLSHLLVPADRMDAAMRQLTRDPQRISTDDNLVLEYSTPRGNARPDTFEANAAALRRAAGGEAAVEVGPEAQ